jgi:predicted outer membrane protein
MKNFAADVDQLSETSVEIQLTTTTIRKSKFIVKKNKKGQYSTNDCDMREALKKVGIDFDDRYFYDYEGEIRDKLADCD